MSERLPIAIVEHFEDMPDPRQRAKVLYPLSEIILTTICAIICGADDDLPRDFRTSENLG